MGEALGLVADAQVDAAAIQKRLDRSIEALSRMVTDGSFDSEAETCGFEIELDLVDPLGRPRHVNEPVLAAMDRHDFQTELSEFNIEFNLAPRPIRGAILSQLDGELAATFAAVTSVAQTCGARIIAIGTLPSLHAEDLTSGHLSPNPRYPLLDAAMAAVRRHPVHLDIAGREHLQMDTDSIAVQAAATSLQVHVRVAPDDFARFYNAAQAIAPAQVAVGGNSPYLLGKRLWHETRIPLIEQSLDICATGAVRRDEPPRVWIGDNWARSAVDVLADNVRRFAPLLPVLEPGDPLEQLASGHVPTLHELRLHNGTVWRWNRPVYDVQHGHPHLRIENRILPSGPTATDMVANAAFFLGLVRAVAELAPSVATVLPFHLVAGDLTEAARLGLDASLHWPGQNGPVAHDARQLILSTLLPLAAIGLDTWAVEPSDRDRYLGVIEQRVVMRRTGADWQTASVDALEGGGATRESALREMVRRYVEHADSREPVHSWPLPRLLR
jgi:gamma-glutamyl:cysteine ligase YbdK (ATP-grasp superfamily)